MPCLGKGADLEKLELHGKLAASSGRTASQHVRVCSENNVWVRQLETGAQHHDHE